MTTCIRHAGNRSCDGNDSLMHVSRNSEVEDDRHWMQFYVPCTGMINMRFFDNILSLLVVLTHHTGHMEIYPISNLCHYTSI